MSDLSTPPTYPYQQFIKTPTELGSSTRGNLDTLKNDIDVLVAYKDVLLSGDSKAQTISTPLGNKFFMKTGSNCKDSNGNKHPRYVFVNNIPDGSSIFGGSGLVPGVLGNIESMDPTKLMNAFDMKSECQEITLEVRDNDNVVGTETHHVNNMDIEDYNPCWFATRVNPVTKASCSQGMTTRTPYNNKPDQLLQLYFTGIAAVGVYLLFNVLYKKNVWR